MFKFLFLLLSLIFATNHKYCYSQTLTASTSDSTIHILLPEVVVFSSPRATRAYYKQYKRMQRLEYNVRKVYPYARLTAQKIRNIELQLQQLDQNKNKEQFLRQQYNDLMREFKAPLMKLSITQGKILIRLIYRETNNSAFKHIRHYKGNINAYFWQTLALMFGNNLKATYDPLGEDREIETIVLKIQKERQGNP